MFTKEMRTDTQKIKCKVLRSRLRASPSIHMIRIFSLTQHFQIDLDLLSLIVYHF